MSEGLRVYEPAPWDKRDARKEMEKLLEKPGPATDDLLTDSGRYFRESCQDLTQCGHGDTGEYDNDRDGEVIAVLWNAWRCGLLRLVPDEEAAA